MDLLLVYAAILAASNILVSAAAHRFPAQFPTKIERYWWRKGFWRHPFNVTRAFEAGQDLVGLPFQICRSVNYKGEAIPGKFLDGVNICYIGFNGKEVRISKPSDYMILERDDNNYEWIPTQNGDLVNGAVIGGISKTFETYFICLAVHSSSPVNQNHNKVLIPGKLQPSKGGCFVGFHGKEFAYEKYFILRDLRYAMEAM